MKGVQEISKCRLCAGDQLLPVLNLGSQALTGVFPASASVELLRGPLELIRCGECGLVQLRHSIAAPEMFGTTYGYRSGLNKSMVEHLHKKSACLQKLCPLRPGDLVLDIGSNDGTLLGSYPADGLTLAGMDPSAEKFKRYYRPDIQLEVDFFSAGSFRKRFPNRQARIVTSIAMFYDLESPLAFAEQVRDILAPDGIWHLEQSYLPTMLQMNAYDTICHEHLEYYALKQIKWIADRCGLKIIDVQFNEINGGSFALTLAHRQSSHPPADELVNRVLRQEEEFGLNGPAVYKEFAGRVFSHRDQLLEMLKQIRQRGEKVLGYGASTKGNVVLQFCNLTTDLMPAVLEVNPDKFGCVTPGTRIPIISETEGHKLNPHYLLVLPWHFKPNIIQRESSYLKRGGKLLFPLPEIHTV